MDWELHKLRAWAAVLNDVLKEYPTATISCAVKQIESRINHIESTNNE
jgi:hypothetical protein